MNSMALDLLRKLNQSPVLKGLPQAQLDWLVERMEVINYAQGEVVIKIGDPLDNMVVVLDGTVAFRIIRDGNSRIMGELRKGEVTGMLPYSRATNATGELFAMEKLSLGLLPKKYFPEMIKSQFELTERLVHVLTSRVRNSTQRQQQNEKMFALGKLSAGLAHELNNPSAAVVRSATDLRKNQSLILDRFKEVISVKITPEQVELVNKIIASKMSAGLCPNMSLMEKTDLEDEIAMWLEDRNIDDPYNLANTFIEFDLRVEQLDEICAQISEEKDIVPLVEWIGTVLNAEKLVIEIAEASTRISNLVTSIKQYTHMDKSPEKQPTNIHDGIRNTITILNHKFRKNQVQLKESFQTDLPLVPAYVGELNQVWTNLIDNALDAMSENGGELEIITKQEGDFVKTHIIDSGTGIPEDIVSRIFDPFYTTKDIGKGTGLGLDTVNRIIDQHNGDIKVNSKPGRTEFVVCFPL